MGFGRFVYRRTIRKLLPVTGYHQHNGVELVSEPRKPLDNAFRIKGDPDKEAALVEAGKQLMRSGDSVTIVGGGHGVSAYRAVQNIGLSGQLTVYEGSEERAKQVENTVFYNLFGDAELRYYRTFGVEVVNAVVGSAEDVFGDSHGRVIPPDQLEPCDVLELDCEGAELQILQEMEIEPRSVIVELHPWLHADAYDAVLDVLQDRGYEIVYRAGHDGVPLDKNQLGELLRRSANLGKRYLENGARYPVVVAAEKLEELDQ